MDFRDFYYVDAIAKNGQLTKAAQQLYVSQPSLSKFLKNLEKEVGAVLFERRQGRYLPTDAGERFLRYARQMLLLRADFEREWQEVAAGRMGRLRIAVPAALGSLLLPAVLPAFRREYEKVEIFLIEKPSEQLEESLLSGEADLAIYHVPADREGLCMETLAEGEAVLVLPPAHWAIAAAQKRAGCAYPWIDLRMMAEEPFLMAQEGQNVERIGGRLLEEAGIRPPVVLRTRSIEGAVRFVAEGMGVCFALTTYLEHLRLPKQPFYCSVGDPRARIMLAAVYRERAYLPAYAKRFIALTKQILGQEGGDEKGVE